MCVCVWGEEREPRERERERRGEGVSLSDSNLAILTFVCVILYWFITPCYDLCIHHVSPNDLGINVFTYCCQSIHILSQPLLRCEGQV